MRGFGVADAVDRQRLGQDAVDRLPRMQRAVRILKHHLHEPAKRLRARQRQRVGAARVSAASRSRRAAPCPTQRREPAEGAQHRRSCPSPIRRRCRSSRPASTRKRRVGDGDEALVGHAQVPRLDADRRAAAAPWAACALTAPTPAGGRAWAADGGPRPAAAGNSTSPRVYGCLAAARLPASTSSTTRPAYITRIAVAERRHEPQVVRDEDQAHAAPGDQLVQDGEHLQLHRHVERRRRLVGDQQIGIGDQHHRDHRALAHAARDLVRVELVDALRVVDLHRFERTPARARAPRARDTRECARSVSTICSPMRHHRVERELRVLQHHRDASAAQLAALPRRAAQQIDAVELEPPRRDAALRRGEAEDGAPGLRLARTRFADDAQPFAAERERHAAHGFGRAAVAVRERDAQVVDDQHRRRDVAECRRIHFAAFGSSASRRPSPSRLNARLTMKIAAPGAAATHHWSST